MLACIILGGIYSSRIALPEGGGDASSVWSEGGGWGIRRINPLGARRGVNFVGWFPGEKGGGGAFHWTGYDAEARTVE